MITSTKYSRSYNHKYLQKTILLIIIYRDNNVIYELNFFKLYNNQQKKKLIHWLLIFLNI